MILCALAVGFLQADLTKSLERAPDQESRWLDLIHHTPKSERAAVAYLVSYMPLYDLKSLSGEKVRDAVDLAYKARNSTRWGHAIPEAVFLDSVVPYSSVTEPRDSMRKEFQTHYLGLVKDAKSPGEAALLVNKTLFKDYHVRYDTNRLRTDQSPPETIAQGMATCTGLSIMLVDALRAVGVPSRLAGISSWPGRGGNHTWVEVWSDGNWHFVGAAEPDPAGLDHAWFVDQAATAIPDKPENAIYAITFRDGGGRFPLEWDPGVSVPAENVTLRYRHDTAISATRLLIDVTLNGARVKANVSVKVASTGYVCGTGESKGSTADINNFLVIDATAGETYAITATYGNSSQTVNIRAASGETVVHLTLGER